MTRPKSLQVHVTVELAERVRTAAKRRDISVSEWIRSLLSQACENDDLASKLETSVDRVSRLTMVGVDALLAGHADHSLRERAHQAYARKCKELGLSANAGEGGSDEA